MTMKLSKQENSSASKY